MKNNKGFTYEQKREYYSKRMLDNKLSEAKRDYAVGFFFGCSDVENIAGKIPQAKEKLFKEICNKSIQSKGYVQGFSEAIKSDVVIKNIKRDIKRIEKFNSLFENIPNGYLERIKKGKK